jgi:alcohol dehydrogenase class IV
MVVGDGLGATTDFVTPTGIQLVASFEACLYRAAEQTNDVTLHNDVIGHEYAIPRSIIYDPRALLDAPRSILLGSGVKAIDHAAETLCAGSASGYAAPLARQALRLFARALPAIASAYEAGRQPALSDLAEAQLGAGCSFGARRDGGATAAHCSICVRGS